MKQTHYKESETVKRVRAIRLGLQKEMNRVGRSAYLNKLNRRTGRILVSKVKVAK